MLNNEPTLNQIDDYNGNESKEKKRTVKLVIAGILIVCAVYAMLKVNFNNVEDYTGTTEKPGINTAKGY